MALLCTMDFCPLPCDLAIPPTEGGVYFSRYARLYFLKMASTRFPQALIESGHSQPRDGVLVSSTQKWVGL